MLLAFSTLACPEWSWQDILNRGPKYGYDGVEVRLIQRDTELLRRKEFFPSELHRRRRELAESGFRVCGLASSVRFDSLVPSERAAQQETGVGYLNLAAELGASFVRVFGDVLPPSESGTRESTIAAIAEGLDRLGEVATPLGIDVLIETHGDFMQSALLRQVLERVRCPQVGVVWDTHHPWRFFGEPVAETFSRLSPWIRHTHWKDSIPLTDRPLSSAEREAEERARQLMAGHRAADYVLFGDGEFPIRECMQLLKQSGYAGWFSYEWERAWHPEIAGPEAALPPFPGVFRGLWMAGDA
jgi:sugar phosphate isomerase/epimerase